MCVFAPNVPFRLRFVCFEHNDFGDIFSSQFVSYTNQASQKQSKNVPVTYTLKSPSKLRSIKNSQNNYKLKQTVEKIEQLLTKHSNNYVKTSNQT